MRASSVAADGVIREGRDHSAPDPPTVEVHVKIKYLFDGANKSAAISVYTEACYLVFEQADDHPQIEANVIRMSARDVPDLMRALKALVPEA
jgi:hypothetical protein